MIVPFEVEHRRQRARIIGHVLGEPGGLFGGQRTPGHEMIDAARHAGIAGAIPVHPEIGVDIVLALGRLHEDEVRAGGAGRVEIDIFLIARHVDPLDRHAAGPVNARMGTIVALHGAIKPSARGAGDQKGREHG
ncbi:hypothetical protein FQZ97_1003010 [compost metagenome]